MTTALVEQECTIEQETALLLERVRAAIKRDDQSEALVLAQRYQRLKHPDKQPHPYGHVQ